MVQVKNKTQNWAKRVIGHDLIQPEVMRMTMYEENSMDFLYNNTGIRNSRKQVFLASEER